MREDAAEQYLSYKLIDSNQDWKSKWFYITNHHPELPKPSGKQPQHHRGGTRSQRCRRCCLPTPLRGVTKAIGTQWESQLEPAAAQPPP
jgi:hypothetical protein